MNRDQYRAEASTERLLDRLNRQAILASQRQSLYSEVRYDRPWPYHTVHFVCTECRAGGGANHSGIGNEILHPGLCVADRLVRIQKVCVHAQEFLKAIGGLGPVPFPHGVTFPLKGVEDAHQ